jgi:hypothetical protein
MKKLVNIFIIIVFVSFSLSAQDFEIKIPNKLTWIAKGGLGTSWVTYPKVFLVDESDLTNVWSVAPATNGFTGYLGVQGILPIGEHWAFIPEINFSYLSGKIQVDHIQTLQLSRHSQNYGRISVPLNFGIISSDDFGFVFGPVVYFTVLDNKGFDEAVNDLTTAANINSDIPVGLAIRLAAVREVSDKMYIEIKFDYDLNKYFEYNNGVYDVKMAMQSITVGLGYLLSKRD